MRAANFDLMKKQILSSMDWLSILSPLDIDDAWFRSTSQDAIENCIPTCTPRGKKNLYTNSEVFSLKRKKNKLQKKFLVTYSASDLSNLKSVINAHNCQICRGSRLTLKGT